MFALSAAWPVLHIALRLASGAVLCLFYQHRSFAEPAPRFSLCYSAHANCSGAGTVCFWMFTLSAALPILHIALLCSPQPASSASFLCASSCLLWQICSINKNSWKVMKAPLLKIWLATSLATVWPTRQLRHSGNVLRLRWQGLFDVPRCFCFDVMCTGNPRKRAP